MSQAKIFIKKSFDFLLDLIFPKDCVGCGREGFWLCPQCKEEIIAVKIPYCPSCKKINDDSRFCSACANKFALKGIIIAGHYKFGPLREAIHSYKYDGILEWEKVFRPLLIKRLKNNLPSGEIIIIPIPLHYKKFRQRGFNQAARLAQIVAKEFKLTFKTNVLKRAKETESQMSLKKKERQENIEGAFKVTTKNKNLINKKTVLLVDDVATTGSTLDEAAKILLQFGAKEVWGVVIAQG